MDKYQAKRMLHDTAGHLISYFMTVILTCGMIAEFILIGSYLAKPVSALVN